MQFTNQEKNLRREEEISVSITGLDYDYDKP